jgi:hypothetical protein
MRLFEIFSRPNKVAITSKFASSYPKVVGNYPGLPEVLIDFVNTKFKGGNFGKRDYKFTGPLSPFYHAHLDTKDGLSIVIYDISGGFLRLYDLVQHSEYEGQRAQSLRKFLRNTKASGNFTEIDYETIFSTGRPTSVVLNPKQRNLITDEIAYLIASEAYETLASAIIDDDWDELIAWILESLSDSYPDLEISATDIFAAFGGIEGLANVIKTSIKNYGKLESFKEFLSN